MPNINYLCVIEIEKDVEFGLRKDTKNYYLDLLINKNNQLDAFKKFHLSIKSINKLIKDNNVKYKNNNEKYLLILKHIISQYLENVKSDDT